MQLTTCTVDLVHQRVVRGGAVVPLTSREADLLRYLGRHPSRVVPRDELLLQVWGYTDTVVSRATDNTIRRLREKIERDPRQPDHVLTVHGTGYRFEPGPDVAPGPDPEPAPAIDLGPCRVELHGRRVTRATGTEVLSESEARLLGALIDAHGETVSREALRRAVWGNERRGPRALDGLVLRVRRKVEPTDEPTLIHTDRGGYRLSRAPVTASLLGRGAALTQLATAGARWVVLFGPAGIGKTTLARAFAPDATWVDAAGVTDPAGLAAAVAKGLGLEVRGGDPSDRVREVLARRAGWVVLDNLEGVGVRAAPLIDHWTSTGGGARLLGTSRVRIGAAGELALEVDPLDPASARTLFAQRARAASSANTFPPDAPLVGEIVDRLDRNPLAIELAAARTSVMGLADLQRRLKVDLLTRAGGDPRHQRLRLLIDDTLAALPPDAVAALEQLSLFRTGATLDDAEFVLGPDAVDWVQLLRDHGLLRRVDEGAGEPRFAGWELVRELLEERGPDRQRLRRHGERLARWGTPEAQDTLGWDHTADDTARLSIQLDDVIRAARALLALGESELGARCAAGALWVSSQTGPFDAALALADAAVAASRPGPVRALIHLRAGEVHNAVGDFTAAGERYRAGLDDLRGHDTPVLRSHLEARLSGIVARAGDADGSRVLLEQSVASMRSSGFDAGWIAFRRSALVRDDPAEEERCLHEAIDAARAVGNGPLLRRALLFLGIATRNDGRYREATAAFEALVPLAEAAGERAVRASTLRHLLNTAAELGDSDLVDRWATAVEACAAELGMPFEACYAGFCRAGQALRTGRFDEATRRLDALEATFGDRGPFAELQAEVWIARAQLLLNAGQPDRAEDLLHRAAERWRSVGWSEDLAVSELAMVHLYRGDVAEARRTLDRAPPSMRAYETARTCMEALVRAGEGRPYRELLDRARAGAARSGIDVGTTDAELVSTLVGRWTVRLLG